MIEINKFNQAHDRFLIIDNKEVYHFGASLKDLGKKWFGFSKFDMNAIEMLGKLEWKLMPAGNKQDYKQSARPSE